MDRTWREEWTAMRMEQMRIEGSSAGATRKQCGEGGPESIGAWHRVRKAAVDWKVRAGWSDETAIAYTVLGCNSAALARSVREQSRTYAASAHLLVRTLAEQAKARADVAPPLY